MAKATIQRVHDVAYAYWGDSTKKDGSADLFILGRADLLLWVKAALDPASAATWGGGSDEQEEPND